MTSESVALGLFYLLVVHFPLHKSLIIKVQVMILRHSLQRAACLSPGVPRNSRVIINFNLLVWDTGQILFYVTLYQAFPIWNNNQLQNHDTETYQFRIFSLASFLNLNKLVSLYLCLVSEICTFFLSVYFMFLLFVCLFGDRHLPRSLLLLWIFWG